MRSATTALGFLLAATGVSCVSTGTHEALEMRVVTLERNDAERRRLLGNAIAETRTQVSSLNQQLEQARVQTRNLADQGARLGGLDEQLRQIHGSVDEFRHTLESTTTEQNAQRTTMTNQVATLDRRITALERRTGLAPPVDPTQIPSEPAQVIAQAQQALTARDYNRARYLASALLQRAPQDPLADDARLIVGRTYLQENRAATAAQEFQQLIRDFPSGNAVLEALIDLAEAFVRLGLCNEAQRTLRLLIDRHGSTPQGAAARRRLEEVRRLPRAACSG